MIFEGIILGVLLVMALYPLFIYWQSKQKVFLYYGLFVLCFFIFFAVHHSGIIPSRSIGGTSVHFTLQGLGYIVYIFFIQELLETPQYIPNWNRRLNGAKKMILSAIFLMFPLELMVSWEDLHAITILLRYVLTFFVICSYLVMYKARLPQINLIILGSSLFVLLANCSMLCTYMKIQLPFESLRLMKVGMIVELLVFAMAIGNKIQRIIKDKSEAQRQVLQHTVEVKDAKIKALKAQMNPHFIFNVLNSIHTFMLKNDVERSSNYLTKFSKVIRKVMLFSAEDLISLKEELTVLRDYITLEQMRAQGGFEYIENIKVNTDAIQIPPLSIQPYIENAIWHGLQVKEGEEVKILHLCVTDIGNDTIQITITDNGVGRRSGQQNKKKKIHAGKGMRVTQDRIQLLHPSNTVCVRDLNLEKDGTTGTEVTLVFCNLV